MHKKQDIFIGIYSIILENVKVSVGCIGAPWLYCYPSIHRTFHYYSDKFLVHCKIIHLHVFLFIKMIN